MTALTQEILIDDYKFRNFGIEDRGTIIITFGAVRINQNDVTKEDKEKIVNILKDMGKWEALVRTGFNIFSEIGIGHFERDTLVDSKKRYGAELYEITTNQWEGSPYRATIEIRLKVDERHRRDDLTIDPNFSPEEIYNQIVNIPKWKAFEKTIELIKEQWINR